MFQIDLANLFGDAGYSKERTENNKRKISVDEQYALNTSSASARPTMSHMTSLGKSRKRTINFGENVNSEKTRGFLVN